MADIHRLPSDGRRSPPPFRESQFMLFFFFNNSAPLVAVLTFPL